MKLYIGSDHAGFKLKEKIKIWLEKNNIAYEDLGNHKYQKNDDYPDYAAKVARKVAKTKSRGVLFCGSAEGMSIAANKIKGIRAVPVNDPTLAKQSKRHNDTNIICLAGGGTIKKVKGMGLSTRKAQQIIKVWLNTKFSTATRHKRRVNKIKRLER